MEKPTVAVLGTGIMGGAMAGRLLDHGFDVTVWNRDRTKAEAVSDRGAAVGADPADALRSADLVLTMLSDGPVTGAVMAEALPSLPPGGLWLQMATVGIDATARLAEIAGGHGVAFVDAPVLGTRQPAEQGKLTVLASGPSELRPRCAPVFDVVGSRTFWLGEVGAGSCMKLVVNTWIASLLAGLAESVALAERVQVDPATFLDVIEGTAAGTPYARVKGQMMIDRTYLPAFPLRWLGKDVDLAVETATREGVALRVTPAVGELIAAAAEQHGADDMSAIIEALRMDGP